MSSCKIIPVAALLLSFPLYYSCTTPAVRAAAASIEAIPIQDQAVQFIRNDAEQKVDVLIDGKHFTSYIYSDDLKKPVLYPIKSANDNFITRGFPLENRPFERTDHPHHVGLWLNYGNVNGLDFWNNSNAIAEDKQERYGSILHRDIVLMEDGQTQGQLAVTADWVDSRGNRLLKEDTRYIFMGSEDERIIDRITRLTAPNVDVSFDDNKEGMLGLRVSRELEHPSDKAERYTDTQGRKAEHPTVNKEGINGRYHGSNSISGEEVWGTRAEWMTLSGEIKGEKITVAIFDHPKNIGYPTYWHARGYGLFAANPLGQKALSGGKEELNFQLRAGESVAFRHRIIIYSDQEVKDAQIDRDFKEFTSR